MRFHYMGRYSGNVTDLPHGEHVYGAVAFKEPENSRKLSLLANLYALIIVVISLAIFHLRIGIMNWSIPGVILALLSMVPHEFLHAICFREDVYMYQNIRQGMLFVTGPEHMTRGRFIFLSMLPNLVFGFLPFLINMLCPSMTILGTMGALTISMGAGDYMNVIHTLSQVPKGGMVYLYGFRSYWYLPTGTIDREDIQ